MDGDSGSVGWRRRKIWWVVEELGGACTEKASGRRAEATGPRRTGWTGRRREEVAGPAMEPGVQARREQATAETKRRVKTKE
jgi:hypothetical protein